MKMKEIILGKMTVGKGTVVKMTYDEVTVD